MVRIKYLVIIIGCCLPTFKAPCQNIFRTPLPKSLSDHPEWAALNKERAQILKQIEEWQFFRSMGLAKSFIQDLEIAIVHWKNTNDDTLINDLLISDESGQMTNLAEAELLLKKYSDLTAEIQQLQTIYKYSGDEASNFDIDLDSKAIQTELKWYQAQPHEKIGEIGAGDLHFAAALMSHTSDITYFINEVDFDKLQAINYLLTYHPILQQKSILPVLGSNSTTGLEGVNLDKIIVRNAIHHFEQPHKMLMSIDRSLKKGGTLFVKEKFTDTCHFGCCPYLFQESQFLQFLKAANFRLVNRTTMIGKDRGLWHLFQFQKL